ncbi:MAG: hypothetical protein K2I17_01825 [Clostridia bacterium]|nr:hypothetical protein [Clostridia bacterium]
MLYILTPIFCAGLCLGTVFSFSKTNANAEDVPVKQSAAYLDLNGSGNILNGFEGAQKEYVYFGSNNNSPVKWRVLSKGTDNRYSSGNMLLWADKQISVEQFNVYHLNPDYGFWGTSRLRASLNGGNYYTSSTSISSTLVVDPDILNNISETASWYGKLFSVNEQKAVVAASSYTTDCFSFDTTYTGVNWILKKEGITVNADGINGKYNVNRISEDHPTSAGASYVTSNGTVKETGQGDKLFLLDYYDVNNPNYGFSDGGVVYANKVASALGRSWSTSSDWYPSNLAVNGRNLNNVTASYLSFTDTNNYYWLRQVGRIDATGTTALGVCGAGNIQTPYLSQSCGVRPAFNLDTTKIVYANSKSVSVNSTFTDVASTSSVTTPEYKLYVKSADYNTYSSKAIGAMSVDGNNLKVIYNNPANVNSGNIVVLLTEKGSTDGAVAYQASATLSSTADASKTAVANFSLSGIDYSQYDTTVLLTSANEGNSAETVYCSYAMEGNVTVPSDVENLTYDGTCKWVDSLSTKPDWFDENLHINDNVMTVTAISYKSMAKDATFTPLTAEAGKKLTDLIVDAGEYEVTMTLDNGLKWAGSNTKGGNKKFKIKIGKKQSSIEVQYATAPTYVPDNLPSISLKAGGTAGTIKWDDGQVPKSGTNSYDWTFTPTEVNNYTTIKDSKSFTFAARVVDTVTIKSFNTNGATVYTNTPDTVLKSYLTVEIKYVSFDETIALDPGDYELQINSNNKLKAGDNKLKVKYTTSDNKTKYSAEFPISGVVELSYKSITNIALSDDTFTYPVTASEILSKITSVDVEMNDGGSDSLTADQIAALMELDSSSDLTVGTKDVTFKIKDTDAETDYEITINQGTLTPTVTFEGLTVTYDGSAKKIEATVSGLPEGFILTPVYTVTGSATTYNAAGYSDAGTYNYSVTFTHTDGNYAQYTTPSTATLKIDKATYTMPTGYDETKQVTYTGSAISLPANWIDPDTLPTGVTVAYYEADGTTPFADKTTVAKYTVKAVFTVADPANYEVPAPVTLTFEITDKKTYKPAVTFKDGTFTYDGQPHVIAIDGEVPGWITVTYYKADGTTVFTGANDVADSGKVIARFTHSDPEYATIPDMTATITIEKAKVNMDGVKFEKATVTGNGQPHKFEATNLPEGVTVEYEYNGVRQSDPFEFTEVGGYTVKAYFTYEDEDNYEEIKPIEATLTVSDAVVTEIKAELSGKDYTTANTLDDVKAKLTVTAIYNNGATAEVEDYELSCEGLREGGNFKFGLQKITVKYTDEEGNEFNTFVEIGVEKEKVAVPTFKGGLSYTGVAIKPTVDNFNGFDSALMTFVTDKLQSGLAVGSYKAVFALNDYENYEWATATTLKKNVFAAVVYDEEITLLANEAAVDWSISKAVLTATKTDGALPVFASDSYVGAFSDVVTLKYYKDEACTEEIAAADLAYETQYFVKAELLDTDNFELDASAAQYTVKSFTYTTPAKELTTWDKIVRFLKANWLWLVIAVVALVLLITVIALIARAAKKKREREEQRRLEEKEEKKREQEERRLEREERMARLSQQQAAPQPQYIPQPMPQMIGQQMAPMGGQSMAMGGGASSNEIAELKAEISALRAEQNSAKEVAALRAEVAAKEVAALRAEQSLIMRTDLNALHDNQLIARMGGEQVISGGISLDKLTEIIRTEVNNAFESRVKAAAQPANADNGAAPVTAQVPPDAVMTTVTTTKIDTTKKPAQTAQAPAPVRTVVRNVVAPMPVDDGRVFDVGGFYKPADPITDLDMDDKTE